MQKIKCFLMGFGFLWIFIWSVLGSLIGIKISLQHMEPSVSHLIFGAEKEILVSAHAHMNLMGMTIILFGLGLHYIWGKVSKNFMIFILLSLVCGTFLFGLGLICQSFNYTFIFFKVLSAIGAILYLSGIISVGAFFLKESLSLK